MLPKLLRAFSIAGLALLVSCSGNSEDGVVYHTSARSVSENKLLRANRYLNLKDMLVVKGYIGRHGLKMNFSDLGYYYSSSQGGNGRKIEKGSVVLYDYRVKLIDGTLLDSSNNGLGQIVIDKSDGITGLHEGLKHFREGDTATFIFLPHLAYGLIGDGEKIPARSTLVYEIAIKSVR